MKYAHENYVPVINDASDYFVGLVNRVFAFQSKMKNKLFPLLFMTLKTRIISQKIKFIEDQLGL